MKKLVLLLLLVGAFATSFAQYDQRDRRDDQYTWKNNQGYDRNYDYRCVNDNYNYTAIERDREIAIISSEYDRKMESVERDWFMNRRHKREAIENLQFQKGERIRMIYAKFNNNRNQCSPNFNRGYNNR